jgi:hypothetical protein
MFGVVVVCYTRIALMLRQQHHRLFRPNQITNNVGIPLRPRLLTRQRRIQPVNHERNRTITVIDVLTIPKYNSSTFHENGDSEATKSSVIQKSTNYRHKNETMLTVSQKIQSDDQDSKLVQSANSDQRHDTGPGETKPTKQLRMNALTSGSAARDLKKINKTTLMMFLITLLHVTTWVVSWFSQIRKPVTNMTSPDTSLLAEKLYMINCMTNPIFYIFMSSKFRQKAKEIICEWFSLNVN